MTRKFIAVPGMAALLLFGCGGPNRNDTAPAAGTGAETGAVPGGTGQVDTSSMMPPDSSAMPVDSTAPAGGPAPSGDSGSSQ
jgi:hypothetical protein